MNCDTLAPHYQNLEHLSFGSRLERSRIAFLGEVATAQRAIVCGGGDGRFLARLLRVNPHVVVDFVELSAAMLEIAQRRVRGMGLEFYARTRFWAGDLRAFEPRPEGYDLIVTNFFLDCFSEQELLSVVMYLSRCAARDARWVLSDFQEVPSAFGRLWSGAVIRGLYAAFRCTTGLCVDRLPDYHAALAGAGFAPRWVETALGGLLHSSLWVSIDDNDARS